MSCRLTKELGKSGPCKPKQVAGLSQKVEGDIWDLAAVLLYVLTEGFAGCTWFNMCGVLVTEVDS